MIKVNWEVLQEFWRNNQIVDWDELEKAVQESIGAQLKTENTHPVALDEWFEKTDWVKEKKDWPFQHLGMHRADILKKYIDYLEKTLTKTITGDLAGVKVEVYLKPIKSVDQIDLV